MRAPSARLNVIFCSHGVHTVESSRAIAGRIKNAALVLEAAFYEPGPPR